ncbi:MAG TPA: glycosyltransferase [Ignavibacteriaceae bacterium]|nr:glycosyltransferase [Ignavibacteriaceae bacterium]
MKVLMLSDPGSYHTIKWSNALSRMGVEIYVFGFSNFDKTLFDEEIKIESKNISSNIKKKTDGSFAKLMYVTSLRKIKNIIKEYKPDLIHVQYATSYGFLGALTNYHPLLIQVWGSDVYNFPLKSIFHEKILRFNLKMADRILSTSKCMLLQTKKFTKKEIDFFYLGVDTEKFKPMHVESLFKEDEIIIGTIKSLEKKYGIEYLIRAFKIVKERTLSYPLKLLIVGNGSLEGELKELAFKLGIADDVIFTGFIQPNEVPKYYNMLDIYVTLSIEESESFGLAVIEAAACEKPSVVSNVGGLPEAVDNNVTGFIVENKNIFQAAESIIKLILDKELRNKMGREGRKRVIRDFNWDEKVNNMIELYKDIIK